MSRRLSTLLFSLWLAIPGLARGGDLTPEQVARIRRDQKAAVDKVNAAHGNKKSSEMSTSERRQVIQEQQEAVRKVMEQNGVSDKDYSRQVARMGPKQNAEVEAAAKNLEEKDKAAAAAKTEAGGAQEPGEIQVQKGFGDEKPLTVEEQEGAPPTVETGLPEGEEGAPAEGSAPDSK